MDAVLIFKCLSDKSRIGIVKSLMEGPMYVELLSERLSLSPSTVSFHLKKLEEAEIVTSKREQYYQVYYLNADIFSKTIDEIIKSGITNKCEEDRREEEYRKKVIDSFFEYGKLKSIPVQQKKRRIVYEEIAKKFEISRSYTEKEVNIIIADVDDDFCTIRRGLVEEGFLSRDNGIYKKSETAVTSYLG